MTTSSLATVPKTYAALLRGVKQVLLDGQREIDRTWVRSYHETGRLITEHILLNERADYGAQVYKRLARDTGGSERRLYQCAQFYRCFPILQLTAKLTWTHYTTLCQVEGPKQRLALAKQSAREDWTVEDLVKRVRAVNATIELESGKPAMKPVVDLLKPLSGIVGCYRVAAVADTFGASGDPGLCVDLGFGQYLPFGPASARYRTKGEIVHVDLDGSISALPDAKPADLFTYAVTVRRVIDGDTIEVAMALPGGVKKLKLRLRGLDCPEIDTLEGKAAKAETARQIAAAESVIICTSKPDKYDRYLAGVFLVGVADEKLKGESPKLKDSESKGSSGSDLQLSTLNSHLFLNNHLLENGFAERKDAWEFGGVEKGSWVDY
jgi:hypothetical protein